MVLIDTGPVLGSVEASLLAGIVDGVILVVCKGGSRRLIVRATSQLASLGARVAGVIFNGATADDISIYGSSSGARSSSAVATGEPVQFARIAPEISSRFGPLASAVMTFAPVSDRRATRRAI
jgi:Mrp family chromosome partitioning ATPase